LREWSPVESNVRRQHHVPWFHVGGGANDHTCLTPSVPLNETACQGARSARCAVGVRSSAVVVSLWVVCRWPCIYDMASRSSFAVRRRRPLLWRLSHPSMGADVAHTNLGETAGSQTSPGLSVRLGTAGTPANRNAGELSSTARAFAMGPRRLLRPLAAFAGTCSTRP